VTDYPLKPRGPRPPPPRIVRPAAPDQRMDSPRPERPEAPQPPPIQRPRDPVPPTPNGRLGIVERLLGTARSMTFTNVLILALIAMVAIPTYAGYRFLSDPELRREFLVRAEILEANLPCIVLRIKGGGRPTRYSVGSVYALDTARQMERFVGLRSNGDLSAADLAAACQDVVATANRLREMPP